MVHVGKWEIQLADKIRGKRHLQLVDQVVSQVEQIESEQWQESSHRNCSSLLIILLSIQSKRVCLSKDTHSQFVSFRQGRREECSVSTYLLSQVTRQSVKQTLSSVTMLVHDRSPRTKFNTLPTTTYHKKAHRKERERMQERIRQNSFRYLLHLFISSFFTFNN